MPQPALLATGAGLSLRNALHGVSFNRRREQHRTRGCEFGNAFAACERQANIVDTYGKKGESRAALAGMETTPVLLAVASGDPKGTPNASARWNPARSSSAEDYIVAKTVAVRCSATADEATTASGRRREPLALKPTICRGAYYSRFSRIASYQRGQHEARILFRSDRHFPR